MTETYFVKAVIQTKHSLPRKFCLTFGSFQSVDAQEAFDLFPFSQWVNTQNVHIKKKTCSIMRFFLFESRL